jgi:hypothetical protein
MVMKIAKIDEKDRLDYLMMQMEMSIFKAILSGFPDSTTRNLTDVVDFLKKRYSTQDNYLDRVDFFNVKFSGTFDEFAAELERFYELFDKTDFREQLLVAKFLDSVPQHLKAELRVRRPTTLTNCVQICNALQTSNLPTSTAAVGKNFKTNYHHSGTGINKSNKPKFNGSERKCFRCGSSAHLASDWKCPARSVECRFCSKKGHFAKCCLSKSGNANKNPTKMTVTTVSHVNLMSTENVQRPHATLLIQDEFGKLFHETFLVDTGAEVSIIPASSFQRHFPSKLRKLTGLSLQNYDKSEIKLLGGIFDVPCSFNEKCGDIDFVVCENDMAVLGVDAISKLKLTISPVQQEVTVSSVNRTEPVPVTIAPEPLPSIKGFEFFIRLKSDAPDTLVQKTRRIPFALQQQVEAEITKLLQQDIIEEIDASSYVSPIVVVPKGDGIRLCVDYKKLNEFIIVDQHPLPTADEIFAKLAGAKFFSKLDLKSAYHQLLIREDSRDLTAFTCHLGLFRYRRLPFGLANAPSAYMKVISHILKPCKNTISYLDDILIFGSTQQEHDECLRQTLERLRNYGLTVNDAKCDLNKTDLKFLGRHISREGVSPLPEALHAVLDAPPPQSKHALRSFLGLFNFYRCYVRNAASLTAPFCELLKNNVPFQWTPELQEKFCALKSCLSEAIPLKFFDICPTVPTFVTCDASGDGISAVLSQTCPDSGVEKPTYFLSRKLSATEKTYSATEKEFLAVLWGIERLHQFLYGRPFTVRTDHQCLRQLLINGVEGGAAPCRVIRWATRLLRYNFQVRYLPGKDNVVADALSRVPSEHDGMALDLCVLQVRPDAPISQAEMRAATQEDELLMLICDKVQNGWPTSNTKLADNVKSFWLIRHELSVIDGILFRSDRMVVPGSLRNRVVDLAHEGHFGISKCKSRIREYYWWPLLNKDVEGKIRHCVCCKTESRESPVQVPVYEEKPWYQVAVDFKGPMRDGNFQPYYLITVVDCYTKFVAARVVRNASTAEVKEFLDSLFSIFGHCTILLSDNGSQFLSCDFSQYLKRLGIVHRRSAVYNPQANGCVERVNKNFKKLLESSKCDSMPEVRQIVSRYLLNYNATSHATTGKTPSEMMLSFKIRTRLSCFLPPTSDATRSRTTDTDASPTSTPTSTSTPSSTGTTRDILEKRALYADSRRRPLVTQRFQPGDLIETKNGQIRRLRRQVGPYTFEMENGYKINARFIRSKVKDASVNDMEVLIPRSVPAPVTNPEDQIPSTSESWNAPSPRDSVSDVSETDGIGRSSRVRKKPTYLKDYLT